MKTKDKIWTVILLLCVIILFVFLWMLFSEPKCKCSNKKSSISILSKERYNNNNNINIAIVFLTVSPSPELIDFAIQLSLYKPEYKPEYNLEYTVYIVLDDNSWSIPSFLKKFPNIHFIKVSENDSSQQGFRGSVLQLSNRASARDKALCYFCQSCSTLDTSSSNRGVEKKYSYYWFLEDDVFIPSLQTIFDMDEKYPETDLLCESFTIASEPHQLDDWHWRHVKERTTLSLPWVSSMVCAVRLSQRMMEEVCNYVSTYNDLFLDEAFFPTLAFKAGCSILNPPELKTIAWRKEWKQSDIVPENLYHPIKNQALHHQWRF